MNVKTFPKEGGVMGGLNIKRSEIKLAEVYYYEIMRIANEAMEEF